MKPNKYMGNGKRYPDGTIWGHWTMKSGEWRMIDMGKGPDVPLLPKGSKKSSAKLLWGGGVGLVLYIALCIWAASQLIPRLS